MRKYVVDYRFDNCGFLIDSIKYNYEHIFKNLGEKYNYLDWLVNEAKFEFENYGDPKMAERVENVLKWIDKVKPKLVNRIQQENPVLFQILVTEDVNIKPSDKLISETDQFIKDTKGLINIPKKYPDDNGNSLRSQNEKLMAINQPPITKTKRTNKLIKCNIPRDIFINAFLKLSEDYEDEKLIQFTNNQDLESQVIVHFSFPNDSITRIPTDKKIKMEWMKTLALLTYFIEYLSNKKNKIFDLKEREFAEMIKTHFCDGLDGGKNYTSGQISDAKRYKNNKGSAKTKWVNGVPLEYDLVNDFIKYLNPSFRI